MTEIIKKLKEWTYKSIKDLDFDLEENQINIEHPSDFKFGDFSTNAAMVLAKQLKRNPHEIANEIKAKLDWNTDKTDVIEKIEVAGAGFINFYLKNDYLIKQAEKINYDLSFKENLSQYGQSNTMVIDYSAPNIAKPFGIGHLRSTNIGQAIYNIYKILGWKTIGDNHIGDWGTQFGKLIVAIRKWSEKDVEEMTIEDLEKLYVKFHKEAEVDESLVEEGREWFSKLEKGDKEAREIWKKCVEISIKEFDRVYELLGVKIDFTHGEAYYEEMLEDTIKEIVKTGIVKDSQGAKIVEFDDMPPAMLQKTNETTTYFTRDMATIKFRMKEWNPDLIIYEVGSDQQLHFKQVFKTAEMVDWKPKYGFVHVAHGLIRWKNGKFSTRRGDTIHLSDVIDKAIERASEIADKSLIGKELPVHEKEEMIKNVAIGAIKFNDLSSDPKKDIIFDWDQVMSLEGDSGPYLQYTYARCMSVLRKTKIQEQKNIDADVENINKEELALLKDFYRFEEKILEAADRYSPAVIAEFLLGLARKYNEFYGQHRIIDQPEETFRVFLTRTTATILSIGLQILGIETIERM